jgi:imidazolonepropionase
MYTMDLLLKNIGVLATPVGNVAKKGKAQGEILSIKNAMIGVENGIIEYVGSADEALTANEIIDCENALVTPGLVDAHTHLVFGGWRQNEFGLKLAGVPYLDILRQGGGILSTVDSTRAESEENLVKKGYKLLEEMMKHGTTTVECKSGYGLDLENERKQLMVARELNRISPVDIVSTFMGAHAIPREYVGNREAYIDLLSNEIMPAIAADKLAEFCDIFCETAVFSPDESRVILARAAELGFRLKAQVDEIDPIGGAELAAEMNCLSAEHLIAASDEGISAIGEKGVIAVLLPATSFYLGKPYARARKMIDENVAVAVATDFNPGSSPNYNMQLPMNLACLYGRMTPAETLTAVTLNAAAAIGRSESIGSVEVGKKADLVIWDATDLDMIFYRYGSNQVSSVVKNGCRVAKLS